MHSGYQKTPPEVHRQPWLDMVGRVPMSACAGQRLSGEASGWVRWSSSRTGWNHGLGCSHGVESSQPGQQGSMDQLVSTISTTVALSVCAARLEADAQLEGVVRSRLASNGDTHTCIDRVPMQCFGRGSQKPSVSAFLRVPLNFGPHPLTVSKKPRPVYLKLGRIHLCIQCI